jgi:hypothetical protein
MLAWIVLGLIAGFIGSKIVNKTGGILPRHRSGNRRGSRRRMAVQYIWSEWRIWSQSLQPSGSHHWIYRSIVCLMVYHAMFRRAF